MQLAASAGTSGRLGGSLASHNGIDVAAHRAARVDLERFLESCGREDAARRPPEVLDQGGGERRVVPPPTPPDAPAAMVVQALDSWSLTELVGVPRIGRLLGAVQRTSG